MVLVALKTHFSPWWTCEAAQMFVEGLMPGHNTSTQASAISYQANCYCARWTPSFNQLPSSQASYPIPPCLSDKHTNNALPASFSQPHTKHNWYGLQITFSITVTNVTHFSRFWLDWHIKLTSAPVLEDVALLIVWHLHPLAIVVSSFSTSQPPCPKSWKQPKSPNRARWTTRYWYRHYSRYLCWREAHWNGFRWPRMTPRFVRCWGKKALRILVLVLPRLPACCCLYCWQHFG